MWEVICCFEGHTPLEEDVSTRQHSHMICGNVKLVVFEPRHLSCWSAVWRPADDCNIFSLLYCHVCRMLDEAPVHLWNHNTCLIASCTNVTTVVWFKHFGVFLRRGLSTITLIIAHISRKLPPPHMDIWFCNADIYSMIYYQLREEMLDETWLTLSGWMLHSDTSLRHPWSRSWKQSHKQKLYAV